jgi:hypothetical protein
VSKPLIGETVIAEVHATPGIVSTIVGLGTVTKSVAVSIPQEPTTGLLFEPLLYTARNL